MTGISNTRSPLESYQGLLAVRKLAQSLNEKLAPDSEKSGPETIKQVAKRLNAKFGPLSTSAPAILQTNAATPKPPKVVKKRKKTTSSSTEQLHKKLPKLATTSSTTSSIRELAARLNQKFCPKDSSKACP